MGDRSGSARSRHAFAGAVWAGLTSCSPGTRCSDAFPQRFGRAPRAALARCRARRDRAAGRSDSHATIDGARSRRPLPADGLRRTPPTPAESTGSSEYRRLTNGSAGDGLADLTLPTEADALDISHPIGARTYLPYQLLRDTEMMSMAHSLEVRVPLLDDAVIATAMRFPATPSVEGKARLAAAIHPELFARATQPEADVHAAVRPLVEWPTRRACRKPHSVV